MVISGGPGVSVRSSPGSSSVAGCVIMRYVIMRYVTIFVAMLASTGVKAACLNDLGRQPPGGLQEPAQVSALAQLVKRETCPVYGLVWSTGEGADQMRSVIVFNHQESEFIRASYAKGRKKQTYKAESWSAATRQSIIADLPAEGFSQKFYSRLQAGSTWVLSDLTGKFLTDNQLGDFLDQDFLTVYSALSDPTPEEVATDEKQSLPPAKGEAHLACLKTFGEQGLVPTKPALKSLTRCQSELKAAARDRAKPRFDDAAKPDGSATASSSTARSGDAAPSPAVSGEGRDETAAMPEDARQRTEAIERRLSKMKDLDELRALALTIPLPDVRAYWLDVVADKQRNLRACLSELARLGAEPSAIARRYVEDCQWQLFAAGAKSGEGAR